MVWLKIDLDGTGLYNYLFMSIIKSLISRKYRAFLLETSSVNLDRKIDNF